MSLPLRQQRNEAEHLWAILEGMEAEERAGVQSDATVTPRLAGYVCRLLSLDEVNHWERFVDAPVTATFRLKERTLDATTGAARRRILENYTNKYKPQGWVDKGWRNRSDG